MEDIEYLSAEFVLFIHMVVIDEEFCEYGEQVHYDKEMRGIKDTNLFSSALMLPQQSFDGKDLYPDILSKASCYLRSFSMNHPFYDGNKRTAVTATVAFLEMNGYKIEVTNEELYLFVKKVVEDKMQVKQISEELQHYVRKSKMSEFKKIFREFNKKIRGLATN